MPQQDYEPLNYATGQPNETPFTPGSEYAAKVPEGGKDESIFESERNKEYMEKRAKQNVKRFTPKPPKEAYSYSLAREARKR